MNPFQKIAEKRAAIVQREEEEQRLREERLRQLESADARKGFRIPNPVRVLNNRKEIKRLRQEIEDYNAKKNDRKTTVWLICGMIVLLGALGIMGALEEDKADSPEELTAVETTLTWEVEPAEEAMAAETEATPTGVSTENTEPVVLETEAIAVPDMEGLNVGDLSVRTENDFAHMKSETVYLGNDEGVTITVRVKKPDVKRDDILFWYDESMLKVDIGAPIENGQTTEITAYATGKKTGSSEMWIFTAHDIETLGEEASGYVLSIQKLDSADGRVVYVTPYGEKYHHRERCAGENALKTTYRDAAADGYEACGKCAK